MYQFSHNLSAGSCPDDSRNYPWFESTKGDMVATELAKQVFHPAFLQEYGQKNRHLSELQRQNLELVRALHEMQHNYYILSCHLSHSNHNAVSEMNQKLARLIDQMIEKAPGDVTLSRTVTELVADIEAKDNKISHLERSLQEQQAVLEHRSYQLTQMEMVARQDGRQEAGKSPYELPI